MTSEEPAGEWTLPASGVDTTKLTLADPGERIVVRYSPRGRADRRLVFEPADDGESYIKRDQVRDHAEEWREVGSETVDSVRVESGD